MKLKKISKKMLERISQFGINLSIFGTEERAIVDALMADGHYDQIASAMQLMTPSKEAEIAKIIKAFQPRTVEIELDSQKEAEQFYATAPAGEITPEKEAELQAKIDKERSAKLEAMGLGEDEGVKAETDDTGTKVTVPFPNNLPETPAIAHDLAKIDGLGEASIAKLLEAGVTSAEQFYNLPFEEKQRIVNPLVAAKFKT